MPKERRRTVVDLDWIMGRPFLVVGEGKLEQLTDDQEAALLATSASPRG